MSERDLDLVRSEPPPRSDAISRKLGRRVDSIGGFIAYGFLWLALALMVGTLELLGGLALTGPKATALEVDLVLAGWVVVFALCWVPFARWVRRRRRDARAVVRDGIVYDGVVDYARQGAVRGGIFTSAGARFIADGSERRAVFAVGGGLHGGSVPVLWAPGAKYALVFPDGRSGRGVGARVTEDILLEKSAGRASITFIRGGSEKFFTAMLALCLPVTILLTVGTSLQKPSELRCDRRSDQCTLSGNSIIGIHWSWSFPASGMAATEVTRNKDGEAEWVAHMTDKHDRQLGGLTARDRQIESYRQHARELGSFIGDRGQETFIADYQSIGAPSLPVLVGMLLVLGWIFFALVSGWRTTLTFDGAAGTLTITRRPALLRPSVRTLPLSSVASAEARAGSLWLMFAVLPTLTMRLYDANGKVLFKRRAVTSNAARSEMEAVNEVLATKGVAR